MIPLPSTSGRHPIGILVCDLDRTLTDPRLRVVPVALERVEEARARGLTTVVATGRTLPDVSRRGRLLRCFDAWILEGGAVVRKNGVPEPQGPSRAWRERFERWLREEGLPYRAGLNSFSLPLGEAPRLHAYPERAAIHVAPNRNRVDVTPAGVHKGTALGNLLSRVEWHGGTEVLVFGDGENDLEMFRLANYSVAVENAVEQVKEAADEVAPGYGGRAVARFLEERLLGGRDP